ncbi:TolC family protein [Ursidibacter sp. B-7004-1]
MKYTSLSLGLLAMFYTLSANANSTKLQDILRYALNEDPRVLEAKANVAVAQAQTKISQAGHYPILSVTNTQVLSQKHKDTSDRKSSRPTLKGQVNLYSWGAIENEVQRDRHKEGFFKFKKDETQEQVGKIITELYLTALRAKENIIVYKESLKRHQNILRSIQTIANYDEGREFEVEEAKSRLLQVESIIEQQTRVLNVSLSQINRYTKSPISENDLFDPFPNRQPEKFIANYKNSTLNQNPTYLAQQEELASTQAGVKAAKAKLLPAINLQGEVYNKGYEVYLGVSWNIFDSAAYHSVDHNQYSEAAAKAKLQEILLELQEQARSSEIDMKQNNRRLGVVTKQIASQKRVLSSVELQFDIAQRSLLDVLNSYKELTDIQVEEVNIKNDYRIAALNYLISQAQVAKWAGIQRINLNL